MTTARDTERPRARQRTQVASSHRQQYLWSPRSRGLSSATCESSPEASLDTSELERLATPRDCASSGMSRIEAPSA